MNEVKYIIRKMVVIGDAAVGKTSLIRRFIINTYDDKYIATIGTKTSKKTLTINTDDAVVNLTLMIWDILGQKDFVKTQRNAYKGARGAFIVLDLTRKETLYSFDNWLFSLYKVTREIPVVVLANKNDLEPKFGKEEIEELIKDYGFPYYLTSAKTGENVNDAFYRLGKMIIEPWEGLKKEGTPEVSIILARYLETEMELGRKLTPIEVEDIIMARYCDLLSDPDFAMFILRAQFKKAGVDFEHPTVEGLSKAIDYLINVVSDRVEATRLEKEKIAYINLINRIDNKAL